ncbi:MAG: HD domain-containing protein, partial [Anaerolineales bacterium]
MDLDYLLDGLPDYVSPADREMVKRAYRVAEKAHRKQKRASGEPYINHCLAVAGILQDLGAPVPAIVAGILHDTVEDTNVTLEDLERDFGEEVAELVDGVTKLTHLPRVSHSGKRSEEPLATRGELAKETLRKTFLAMGDDVRVVVIKLADRLHNMRTLSHLPPEKQQRIAEETQEIFAPLANRLGIWQIKWELEDLSFRYVSPEEYKAIASHLAERRIDREKTLEKITETLQRILTEAGIEAEVTGRPKHLYSIYR